MKYQQDFRGVLRILVVTIGLMVVGGWLVRAQPSAAQTVSIAPSATLGWDQIVARGDVVEAMPRGGLFIRPPKQKPGPTALDDRHWRSDAPRRRGQPGSARLPLGRLSAPPVPTANFEAVADNNSVIPPDTHGSAGPLHLVTMLNSQMRIQDKSGGVVGTISLASFWAVLTGDPFDPQVHYDVLSGRWIASCVANAATDSSEVYFAISSTSDPTGVWSFYRFDADAAFGGPWADYPGIGFSNQFIAITANMWTVGGSWVGAKMWVIDKAGALAGGTITVSVFPAGFDAALGAGIQGITLRPCISYSSSSTLYLVDNSGYFATSDTTFLLRLSRLTGGGTSPSWAPVPGSLFSGTGLMLVDNNFNLTQRNAPQAGSTILIQTNDNQLNSAVFRDGRIWCAHSGGLPEKIAPAPDRTAVFWYEIDPLSMPSPIVQSGVFDGGAGVHLTFPSIAANKVGDVLLGFSRVDASRFAEAAFAGRRGTDPPQTMTPIGVLKAGMGAYSKFFGGPMNRWGDYSNTCVDPVDDLTMWTIQQYAGVPVGADSNSGRWGTWWGKIDPATALPVALAEFTGHRDEGGAVVLRWRTLSEVNSLGFELERSEAGGSFTTVAGSFTPGSGTSLISHEYEFIDRTPPEGILSYRLLQLDLDGATHRSDAITLWPLPSSSLEEELAFSVAQNYPNPFNPVTTIGYTLPERLHVVLVVLNPLGQQVRILVDEEQEAGLRSVSFDASALASGWYVYRLAAGSRVVSRRMVLLR